MAVREWQWCEDNPVRKVSKPKEPRGEYVFSQRRKERGYWNPAKSAEILIHWIDSETQALLDRLIEGLPTVRLLLLVNYRPEYQHVWGSKTYYI